MRLHTLRAASVAALLVVSAAATAGEPPAKPRPDFSGKWVLDQARTRLQPGFPGGIASGVVRIAHREPSFAFRRAFTRGGESELVAFTLTTDGKEVAGSESGMPTRSTLAWDGDALVYLLVYAAPRGEARNTVRYTLEDGGRTLVARESFKGPRLSYENVWVFAKAE